MTYSYALLDENNIVSNVTGELSEPIIIDGNEVLLETYYQTLFNCRIIKGDIDMHGGVHLTGGMPLRKNAPSKGFKYDEQRDAFVPPQPFPSWTLNEDTCQWDAPTPMPVDDTKLFWWDENTLSWV